jgi:hypothetical protein
MTQIDKTALERIIELEGQLSLSEEDCDELRVENQLLKAQLQALMNGQKVDYQVG